MLRFTQGNLLDAPAEALVNTVNTVGVMGKGIALMFKEAFPQSFREYAAACKKSEVRLGEMFVTAGPALQGPRWIVHFPTKEHWRNRTRKEWVRDGLDDLRRVIADQGIRSIAIPPLGCGHGGLDWADVRPMIEVAMEGLEDVEVFVYEPIARYQNVAKRQGVEKLTPARALIAELVRRYWILGIRCSLLEVQKLAWFLERELAERGHEGLLDLRFEANRYGPYSDRLRHLLNALDGSYLRSAVRIPDAGPGEVIGFDDSKRQRVALFLRSLDQTLGAALEATAQRIDGFESPLGMELLATVDWLLFKQGRDPHLVAIKAGLVEWPGGRGAGERKLHIFNDRLLRLALDRLAPSRAVS